MSRRLDHRRRRVEAIDLNVRREIGRARPHATCRRRLPAAERQRVGPAIICYGGRGFRLQALGMRKACSLAVLTSLLVSWALFAAIGRNAKS